jgi:hypothetical protein
MVAAAAAAAAAAMEGVADGRREKASKLPSVCALLHQNNTKKVFVSCDWM